MRLAIYINKLNKNIKKTLNIILDEFSSSKHQLIYLNEQKFISKLIRINIPPIKKNPKYDILISIGGDGTILSAIRSEYNNEKPILGIHVGQLGFLAEADTENLQKVLRLIKKSKYKIEDRSLFEVELLDKNIKKKYVCVNDVVVDRGKSARTMEADVYENNLFVSRYKGDGFIISTANGSTAYSLSAGGPIIYPNLDLITITPICSHSLSTRTIVLSGKSNISIHFPDKKVSRTLTIDGQVDFKIKNNMKINISISSKRVYFLLTDESNYFNKLRNKVGWFRSRNDKYNY